MEFAARHCRFNFCNGAGAINDPRACVANVARLHAATQRLGTGTKALASTMIIADETDAAAMAKWEHYKAGTDLEAIAWRSEQAAGDQNPTANSHSLQLRKTEPMPNNGAKLIGSYATVAGLLDEMAAIEGLAGVMLTFDDFLIGMEQFGTRIQPLMASRRHVQPGLAA
jgi:pyrimidine oxygenase